MLIELWEKIRGYDQWAEATATVKSSHVNQQVVGHDRMGRPFYEWRGDEELIWTDKSGVEQSEPLSVSEDSPLFQYFEGKALRIRYNPADPAEYYVPEQLEYQIRRTERIILWGMAIVSAIVTLFAILLRN